MKQSSKLFVILAIIAGLGYTAYSYSQPVRTYIDGVVYQIRATLEPPCSSPLTYSLGGFDIKFGISKDYFLGALKDAEAIWEQPFGKQLFAYEAGIGRMKINLIYDYRQEASSKLQGLGITVENNKASYDALDEKYAALKAQYTRAKAAYDSATAAFKVKYQTYQDKVAYWNKRGGAPRADYDALHAEQIALENELAGIKAQEAPLNEMTNQINSMVVVINQLAASLNLTVKKYNTIGASLGESFEEGLYHTDGTNKEIDIYEFKSRDSLVRVLAHELGHALDLDHVTDPKAIMYSYNQGTNLALTSADLGVLKARCWIK